MKFKSTFSFLLFLCCFTMLIGQETERIIDFDILINVNNDRSIEVKEYIKVYADGNVIKRGITRNLPSHRKMNHGSLKMKYEILDIQKNGKEESYFTESYEHGFKIYIGQEEVFLDSGEYTYMIHYRVPNQIGFFNDYDEIYWNAIGTDVEFSVDNATCKVRLPSGASVLQEKAYIGTYNSTENDYTYTKNEGLLDFRPNRKLDPKEGFTIAIGFDKGIIKAPSFLTRYGTLLIVLLGALFLLPYYFYTWWKYGRDHETPPVSMSYESPNELSAASINYILANGRYDNKSYTASIISLAVKGFIKIEEYGKDIHYNTTNYKLTKLKNYENHLAEEEIVLMKKLFNKSDSINIDGEHDLQVQIAHNAHRKTLTKQHKAFISEGNNFKFAILPIIVSLGIILLGFFAFVLVPYSYGFNVVILGVFALLAIIGIGLYIYLIQQPTVEKLKLKSNIKGYQQYLGLMEDFKDGEPKPTTTHFEKSLPFAYALGVEDKWANRFKSILEKTKYQPSWNNNTDYFIYSTMFSNQFHQRTTSTITPPPPPSNTGSGGSGSFGGGGFSGGGGGGGGVGGW